MPISTIGSGGLDSPLTSITGLGVNVASPNYAVQALTASGASGTLSLSGQASGSTGGPSYILMGNSDSAGTTGPNVISAANRQLQFGVGNSFSAAGGGTFTPQLTVGASNVLINGVQKTWPLGQYSNAGLSTAGANIYRITFNRSYMYYYGITFDIHMGGGKDWGGHGSTTYYAKMMVTFSSTTGGRVHTIQEYSRSYLDNNGGEINYSTNTFSYDASYLYLDMNYRSTISTTDGFRPQMWVTTYDAAYQNQNQISQIVNVAAI